MEKLKGKRFAIVVVAFMATVVLIGALGIATAILRRF